MSERIIGIDPGATGGIASLTVGLNGTLDAHVHDLPVITDRNLTWIDGGALQSLLFGQGVFSMPTTVVVERVSAMPKQGVSSSFKFGCGFGSILSVVQAVGHRLEFVTPAQWKRDLTLSSDKKASLHKARLLFPSCELHLAKHEGRAEALLIAHWYATRAQRAAA